MKYDNVDVLKEEYTTIATLPININISDIEKTKAIMDKSDEADFKICNIEAAIILLLITFPLVFLGFIATLHTNAQFLFIGLDIIIFLIIIFSFWYKSFWRKKKSKNILIGRKRFLKAWDILDACVGGPKNIKIKKTKKDNYIIKINGEKVKFSSDNIYRKPDCDEIILFGYIDDKISDTYTYNLELILPNDLQI